MKIKILHQDCNPELANDTSLPYTTYLITYKLDGKVCYDIAMGSKKVEIFDHYWDNYRHDLCLLYTSPSPRDGLLSRMPSSA